MNSSLRFAVNYYYYIYSMINMVSVNIAANQKRS